MINKRKITEELERQGFISARILKNPEGRGSVIIAAFPLYDGTILGKETVPVASFARSNHYGEAVQRLKKVSQLIREQTGLLKKDVRIFSNSTLPEKLYAASSGLGFYGRNSLIITKEAGSRIVLAGLIVPFELSEDSPLEKGTIPGALCGSCRRCQKACPTGALEKSGQVNRDKCLQSLATDDRVLSEEIMEKWGVRLYGCTICQDCCPFNRSVISPQEGNIKGSISNTVTYSFLLKASDDEIKKELKGTALGLSWIKTDYLRRNTLLSLGAPVNRDRLKELIQEIRPYENHPDLGYVTRWLLRKIEY